MRRPAAPNPATATQLRALLLGCEGVTLHPPVGHRDTVAALLGADFVLSDSGGIQEECATLGVPLLVLRERTERPEAIASGAMTLVGTDPDRIVGALRSLCSRPASLAGPCRAPFGDGKAGERIAAIVEAWLNQQAGGELDRAHGPKTAARPSRRLRSRS